MQIGMEMEEGLIINGIVKGRAAGEGGEGREGIGNEMENGGEGGVLTK